MEIGQSTTFFPKDLLRDFMQLLEERSCHLVQFTRQFSLSENTKFYKTQLITILFVQLHSC